MAIGFVRFKFVKRSQGKNACQKSSYNSRSIIRFDGTKFQEPCTYNFINSKEELAYSTIIVPDHVDEKFKNKEYLWNTVEKSENRKDSQVCWEMVFALPDDKCVTLKDRIELSERFAKECFVKHGVAVQADIHKQKNGKNWHVHFLGTLREFDEIGKGFSKTKIRGKFLPGVRKGRVVFAENFVEHAVNLQNKFFKEKGYDISVDPSAFIAQKHIGPQRFRGNSQSLIEENELRKELNSEFLKEPKTLLEHITKTHSVFDYNTVEFYVQKIDGLDRVKMDKLVQEFWIQKEILPLFLSETGEFSERYTTQKIIDEEKEILRNAVRLKKDRRHQFLYRKSMDSYAKKLNDEQKAAFRKTVEGKGLVCINGLAGTGKSTLLDALKDFYKDCGYVSRGLGPDTATAAVLKERGFSDAENIHRFLFNYTYGNREVNKGGEIWFVDESSKIGNSSLKELLKVAVSKNVKVVFTGDVSQLSPVERGAGFVKFCEKFGYISLDNVQRQKKEEDREVVRILSGLHVNRGKLQDAQKAIDVIESSGGFYWDDSKATSIKSLIRAWATTKALDEKSSTLVFALKKQEVEVLNDIIRLYRKRCGELGEKDYLCRSEQGTFVLSEGDSIVFKRRNSEIGVENGDRGVVKSIKLDLLTVAIEEDGATKTVQFSPEEYSNFQLGYAMTNFAAQGSTFDHSFVMMCPQMRLNASYVFFSRHRKTAKGFISKDEIANLTTLKKLVTKEERAQTTIGLLTGGEIERKEKLDGYIQSDSILKRAYGKTWKSVSNPSSPV